MAPKIESPEEARAVAAMLQSGQMTEANAAVAEQALREFDSSFSNQASEMAAKAGQQISSGSDWKAGLGRVADTVMGLPENVGSMITGMGATAAKLGYMYAPGSRGIGAEARRPQAEKIQKAMTIEPVTDVGKRAQENIQNTLGVPVQFARDKSVQWLGEKGGDAFDAAMLIPTLTSGYNLAKGGPTSSAALNAAERGGAIKMLQNEGMPLRGEDVGGNRLVTSAAKATEALYPSKSGQRQLERNTEIVLDKANIQGTRADVPTMKTHKGKLGTEYDTYAAQIPVAMDRQFIDLIDRAIHEEQMTMPASPTGQRVMGPIEKNAELMAREAGGHFGGIVPGPVWQEVRSRVVGMEGDAARQLREAIDNAVERHAPTQDMANAVRQTNHDWRTMLQIEDAAAGNPAGLIDPATMWRVLAKDKNRGQSFYGHGPQDLVSYARAADLILGSGKSLDQVIAAIPYSALGAAGAIGGLWAWSPEVAVAGAVGLPMARMANESNFLAGRTAKRKFGPKPRLSKKQIAGLLVQAGSSEERKKLIEEYTNAAE